MALDLWALPLSADQAQRLIGHAAQALYGKGEQTDVDINVRRVWQLGPDQFSLSNPRWEALLKGILGQVTDELGVKGTVEAKLYKLLIYEEGSFFLPHRDSEKAFLRSRPALSTCMF